MGNKNRRRKRNDRSTIRGVALPSIDGDSILVLNEIGSEEEGMKPIECPKCHKPFKDVGSFIHHMWVMHEWGSTESLIYWGDNYKATEFAEKEEGS